MARLRALRLWPRSILGAVVALVVLVVLLGGTALAVTSRPQFCGSCHLMETRYVSWKRSTHADSTDCITCHSKPGLVNNVMAHLAATRYLWVMASGRRSGPIIHGTAYTSACMQCHSIDDIPEGGPTVALGGAGHVPAHRAHADFDVDCTDCHYRPSLHGEEVLVPMQVCVDCHLDRWVAAGQCQLCHGGPRAIPAQLGAAPMVVR